MTSTSTSLPTGLSDVTPAQWQRLAQRRIFFGHQSVGQNILDGMSEVLKQHPEIPLRVVASDSIDGVAGPALIQMRVGKNGDPASKARAFASAVGASNDSSLVAFYKFCYLDTDFDTDPAAVFGMYRSELDRIRRPGLQLAHVTMPLTTSETGPRALVKRLLGKRLNRDLNAKRAKYNAALRAIPNEPVFDLAKLESTRPDGSRSVIVQGGDTVEVLAPEFTEDGGHLNQRARTRVAESFLVFLARLP
jgi:hypothetical protein